MSSHWTSGARGERERREGKKKEEKWGPYATQPIALDVKAGRVFLIE